MIQINCLLILSAIMMFAGIFGFLTRRSTLAILLSIELMLNAADINFAVFNRFLFSGQNNDGFFFTLFSIAITAAESAIAIAIMINIYRHLKDLSADKLDKMKW
ncbi:MAG: NADH-quinone oxidoreductase subunit NuoK [Alloprevotella sp.]|nr:NADH-quinone oxidoreductase subunit NuoK [Alloprevotella sp.]